MDGNPNTLHNFIALCSRFYAKIIVQDIRETSIFLSSYLKPET
jgi:hypothetical protein